MGKILLSGRKQDARKKSGDVATVWPRWRRQTLQAAVWATAAPAIRRLASHRQKYYADFTQDSLCFGCFIASRGPAPHVFAVCFRSTLSGMPLIRHISFFPRRRTDQSLAAISMYRPPFALWFYEVMTEPTCFLICVPVRFGTGILIEVPFWHQPIPWIQ